MARTLEEGLQELYRSKPSEFTKKRDELAAKLDRENDRDAARRVRARRRPTQIAWVLNELSRRHPEEIEALVDVGRQLAREQRKALRGEAAPGFRDTIAQQRELVAKLTHETARLMKELEINASGHLDEVAGALHAALADLVVGAQLEEGQLEKVPKGAGFGALVTGARARPARKAEARARPAKPKRRQVPATRKAAQAARAQAARAERATRRRQRERVAAARRALRQAEAQAKKARRAAALADAEARARTERAKKLAEAAEVSARAVEDAKRRLAESDGRSAR